MSYYNSWNAIVLIDMLKSHVDREELLVISEDASERNLVVHACCVCGRGYEPVTSDGHPVEDNKTYGFHHWEERHERNCPLELLDNFLQNS